MDVEEIGRLIPSVVEEDRIVSDGDLEVLEDVAIELGEFVAALYRYYYRYIFNSIIGEKRANSYWSGGKSPEPLGSLQVGASRNQLTKLVDKCIFGGDSPALNNMANGYGAASGPFSQAKRITAKSPRISSLTIIFLPHLRISRLGAEIS